MQLENRCGYTVQYVQFFSFILLEDAIVYKAIDSTLQSIGIIALKNKTETGSPHYTGTGWLVASKEGVSYIFTNYHVIFAINSRKNQTENEIKVVIQFDHLTEIPSPNCAEHEVEQEAEISDENLDYAVLKINKFLPKRAPLNVSTSIPNNDNKIFAIGHVGCTPLKVMEGVIRLKQPKESWKNWLKSNAMHYCPTPSCEGGNTEVICPHNLPSEKWVKVEKREKFLLVHNCQTDHGTSGAPLVNSNGNVFAMHSRGMFFGNAKERQKATYEFAHTIKSIAVDILGRKESLAKELFHRDFISGLRKSK